MNSIHSRHPRNQQGVSTLLIAMLLLAILTIASIFAAAFGVNEQRTSANEYRYKLTFQAAEAGLNQAIEYLKLNTRPMLSTASGGWLFAGDPRWKPCTDPKPGGMALDPCLAEPDTTRWASMYRYVGAIGSPLNGILPLSEALPGATNQTFTTTGGSGGFATTYSTYATLCRLDLSTAPPRCSLVPTTEGTFYVTVVSTGALTNEQSTASVKQSYGTFRLLGATPAAPLIAAGVVGALGNTQIVPNPDAGGFGVPVSVWSNKAVTVSSGGSFASCQLGEWLANPLGGAVPPPTDLLNGVCAKCSCNDLCPGYGLLSGNAASCGLGNIEGEDILDVDGHESDASPKLRDSKYFPADLFAYTFGVPSSSANDYLVANATEIKNCGSLTASSSGLYWYTGGGDCKLGSTVGSVQEPVVLVSDSKVDLAADGQFYGIIYVRAVAGTGELLKAGGGGQVYGSVILEGAASLGGNGTIIYNKAVLRNIGNSPKFIRYGPIPGSWSDSVTN